MVEKKYADSKTFTFKISKGLDIKGSKVINVADPTSTTDGRKKGINVWSSHVKVM